MQKLQVADEHWYVSLLLDDPCISYKICVYIINGTYCINMFTSGSDCYSSKKCYFHVNIESLFNDVSLSHKYVKKIIPCQ